MVLVGDIKPGVRADGKILGFVEIRAQGVQELQGEVIDLDAIVARVGHV